jgi:hypothetical protein
VSAVTVMVLGMLVVFTLLTQLATRRPLPAPVRAVNDAVFAHRAGRGWELPKFRRPTANSGKHSIRSRTRH